MNIIVYTIEVAIKNPNYLEITTSQISFFCAYYELICIKWHESQSCQSNHHKISHIISVKFFLIALNLHSNKLYQKKWCQSFLCGRINSSSRWGAFSAQRPQQQETVRVLSPSQPVTSPTNQSPPTPPTEPPVLPTESPKFRTHVETSTPNSPHPAAPMRCQSPLRSCRPSLPSVNRPRTPPVLHRPGFLFLLLICFEREEKKHKSLLLWLKKRRKKKSCVLFG